MYKLDYLAAMVPAADLEAAAPVQAATDLKAVPQVVEPACLTADQAAVAMDPAAEMLRAAAAVADRPLVEAAADHAADCWVDAAEAVVLAVVVAVPVVAADKISAIN